MPSEPDPEPALMSDCRQNTAEAFDISRIIKGIPIIVAIIIHKGTGGIQRLHILQALRRRIKQADPGIGQKCFHPPLLEGSQRHCRRMLQGCCVILFYERPGSAFQRFRDRKNTFLKALLPDDIQHSLLCKFAVYRFIQQLSDHFVVGAVNFGKQHYASPPYSLYMASMSS